MTSALVRTPATAAYFRLYQKSLGPNFNVVQHGGWYKLETEATAQLASQNLAKLKPHLPKDLDIVQIGGWHALEQLAADPKGLLMQMIQNLPEKHQTSSINTKYLPGIVALLEAHGKGFDSNLVNGEWVLALQQQGTKSPKVQKWIGRQESAGNTKNVFDISKLEFTGDVRLLKGLGNVSSTVKYRPVADNFDRSFNSIVLRRIACDITKAGIKVGRLPRLSLFFLRKKGGYLDFVYLDKDIRVTKGNRGGLFVHVRPEFMAQL